MLVLSRLVPQSLNAAALMPILDRSGTSAIAALLRKLNFFLHEVGLAARSVDQIKINTITYLEQSVNDWQTVQWSVCRRVYRQRQK